MSGSSSQQSTSEGTTRIPQACFYCDEEPIYSCCMCNFLICHKHTSWVRVLYDDETAEIKLVAECKVCFASSLED